MAWRLPGAGGGDWELLSGGTDFQFCRMETFRTAEQQSEYT